MWESLHTVRKYLWRYRRGMALGGFCLVMKDVAQALQPLMIRGAVDSFRSGAVFVRFAGYLVGLALLKGIFQYWMRVILIGISRDIRYAAPCMLIIDECCPDFFEGKPTLTAFGVGPLTRREDIRLLGGMPLLSSQNQINNNKQIEQ